MPKKIIDVFSRVKGMSGQQEGRKEIFLASPKASPKVEERAGDIKVAHSEEVACFVFCQEDAVLLAVLPSISHVARQAALLGILQQQAQVLLREEGLLRIDDVHVSFPQVCLYL